MGHCERCTPGYVTILSDLHVSFIFPSAESGEIVRCSQAVICTGTFLSGEIHIGMKTFPAGRMGEDPSVGLSGSLRSAGFKLGRLQTGTPARLRLQSINFNHPSFEKQPGDEKPRPFSYMNKSVDNGENQIFCWKTMTNETTHQIVRDHIHRSVHIQETRKGPRYCPSLEAKVRRFPQKTAHVVWLEPEGYDSGATRNLYLIFCALTYSVQT